LIKNGFSYKFSSPKIVRGDDGQYHVFFDNMSIYIRREWLESARKYKLLLADKELMSSAIADNKILSSRMISDYIGFRFALKDQDDEPIVSSGSYSWLFGNSIESQLGKVDALLRQIGRVVDEDGYYYYGCSNVVRCTGVIKFGPLAGNDIKSIKNISAKAVLVEQYDYHSSQGRR